MHIPSIPCEADEYFQKLIREAELKPAPTPDRVVAYADMLRKKAKFNEFLDMAALNEITDRILRMLTLAPGLANGQRFIVYAAVHFFLQYDDDDHDYESILGLEDDVGVINAVIAHVGLSISPIPTGDRLSGT